MQRYRVLLVLLTIASAACRRGSLEPDGGGPGIITTDAPAADAIISEVHPTPGPIDAAPSADANCGVTDIGETVYPSAVLVLLDQSVMGDRSKWNELLTALTDGIAANGSAISWGLYTFPEPGPACGPDTAASLIDVPVSYADYAVVAAGIAAARADGNGSPTAAAIELGRGYLPTLPRAPVKWLMLVTDHAPSCAGAIGALSEDGAQAQADAIAAINAAKAENDIKTIVLAPSSTAPSEIPALNALATAGDGFARLGNPLVFQDETSLPVLFTPRPKICSVLLSGTPPVPDAVAVRFNDQPVPYDPSHAKGWDYTDASHEAIEFFGDWCVTLLDTQSWRIQAYYGCPSN